MPHPRGNRIARSLRAATVCLLVLQLLASAAAQAQAPPRATAATTELTWTLKKTTVNPERYPQPVGGSISARSGSLTWQVLVAPQVRFDVTYPAPPAQLKPSVKHEHPVTVSGRVTGGTDTGGYRRIDVIGYVNDRWEANGPGLWQNCKAPGWGDPIACDAPATDKGKIAFFAPQPRRAGETFSWGIGALNCTACYVRFEYVAKDVAAKKPPVTMGTARLRMKAEAIVGSQWLFPSYVQTFAGGDLDFSERTRKAFGQLVIQHEFSLPSLPDWKIVVDMKSVLSYDTLTRTAIVELAGTVRTSSFSGCKYGAKARVTLVDSEPDAAVLRACGDVLKFIHRKPDPVDRVTVTIKRPG